MAKVRAIYICIQSNQSSRCILLVVKDLSSLQDGQQRADAGHTGHFVGFVMLVPIYHLASEICPV